MMRKWLTVLGVLCVFAVIATGCGEGDEKDNLTESMYDGEYSGTLTGEGGGTWEFAVDKWGHMHGTATLANGESYVVRGEIRCDGSISAGLYDGSLFEGNFMGSVNNAGHVYGQWSNDGTNYTGNFSGDKQN